MHKFKNLLQTHTEEEVSHSEGTRNKELVEVATSSPSQLALTVLLAVRWQAATKAEHLPRILAEKLSRHVEEVGESPAKETQPQTEVSIVHH